MNLLSQASWHMILILALQRQRQPIPLSSRPAWSQLHRETLSQLNKTKQTTRKQLLVLFLGSSQGLGLLMHLNKLAGYDKVAWCCFRMLRRTEAWAQIYSTSRCRSDSSTQFQRQCFICSTVLIKLLQRNITKKVTTPRPPKHTHQNLFSEFYNSNTGYMMPEMLRTWQLLSP